MLIVAVEACLFRTDLIFMLMPCILNSYNPALFTLIISVSSTSRILLLLAMGAALPRLHSPRSISARLPRPAKTLWSKRGTTATRAAWWSLRGRALRAHVFATLATTLCLQLPHAFSATAGPAFGACPNAKRSRLSSCRPASEKSRHIRVAPAEVAKKLIHCLGRWEVGLAQLTQIRRWVTPLD